MDQVLAETLKANLKAAKTPEAKSDAQTLAMIALVDCQRKTAERVKALQWRTIALAIGSGTGIGAVASNFRWICSLFTGGAL